MSYSAFFCTKAGRQLNVLQRMSRSQDYVSRMAIYNSIIISQNRLENSQKQDWKHVLRFFCNYFVSSYSTQSHWENMVLRGWNSSFYAEQYMFSMIEWNVYIEEMYIWSKKQFPYGKTNSTTYTLWSQIFQNGYGAKIWNLLPASYISRMGVSFDILRNMNKTWSGPTCKCSVCCLFTTWLSYHINVY